MIAMATHKMTVMILLERGALPEHSKVKEEKLPALPSDDTSWTYMKLKWTNTCTYAYICIDYILICTHVFKYHVSIERFSVMLK